MLLLKYQTLILTPRTSEKCCLRTRAPGMETWTSGQRSAFSSSSCCLGIWHSCWMLPLKVESGPDPALAQQPGHTLGCVGLSLRSPLWAVPGVSVVAEEESAGQPRATYPMKPGIRWPAQVQHPAQIRSGFWGSI